MSLGQARQNVSKWDLAQWKLVIAALKDEDWLPEAKKRVGIIGGFAGMNLSMMVGAIASMAMVRLTNRRQKTVANRRSQDARDELARINEAFTKKVTKKAVSKQYDATIDKLQQEWQDKADKAEKLGKKTPARVLPGADLSDRLWVDGDKLIADIQTRMFNAMTECRDFEDLADLVKPHVSDQQFNPNSSVADRVKQEDYVTERLLRTELARMKDSINTASFIANGIKWVNIVTEPGACAKCAIIAAAGPYPINTAPLLPDETHPNCRCGKVPALNKDDAPYLPDDAIVASGAITGKWNDENDSDYVKRDAIANRMYDEIRNAKPAYLERSIVRSSGLDEDTVRLAINHVFNDNHELLDKFGDKRILRKFDVDYDMALSFQRLRVNKAIKPDIILLKHEAAEARLMQKRGIYYEKAHAIINKEFDYATELTKWKEEHDK